MVALWGDNYHGAASVGMALMRVWAARFGENFFLVEPGVQNRLGRKHLRLCRDQPAL